jgi:transmembrane sensor
MSAELQGPLTDLLADPVEHTQLERLRRRVAASRRLPRERAWRVAPFAAAALVAIAALIVWWVVPVPSPSLGPLGRRDGAALHAMDGARRVALDDGSVIELGEGTHIDVVENDAHHILLAQSDGRATYDIRPGGPRRWSIDAGVAMIDVLGTRFSIERHGDRVRVQVERGHVRVRALDVLRTLGAGQSIEIGGQRAPEPIAPPPQPSDTPSAQVPALRPRAPDEPEWRELADSGQHPEAFAALGERGLLEQTRRASSVDDLFRLADTARLSGHPGLAVEPLTRLVDEHANDPRAGLAALTLGRIEIDSLHHPDRAIASLTRALELGVAPHLHEIALARLAEAYRRTDRLDDARETARRYLREHPGGVHAPEMEALAR